MYIDQNEAKARAAYNLKAAADRERCISEAARASQIQRDLDRATEARIARETPKATGPAPADVLAEAMKLAEHKWTEQAYADLTDVTQHITDARTTLAQLEAKMNAAIAARNKLAASDGDAGKWRAAEEAIRGLDSAAAFARNRVTILTARENEAQVALKTASSRVWARVLAHGIGLRLAAAQEVAKARDIMATAERAWAGACGVVSHAISNGARLKRPANALPTALPRSPEAEQAMWRNLGEDV